MIRNDVRHWARYGGEGLELGVSCEDAALRKQLPAFDGYEKAFALVPKQQGDAIVWQRHELAYNSTMRMGLLGEEQAFDLHRLVLAPGNYDPALIARLGVAFGLDTNVETVWLQPGDGNVRIPLPRPTGLTYGKLTY